MSSYKPVYYRGAYQMRQVPAAKTKAGKRVRSRKKAAPRSRQVVYGSQGSTPFPKEMYTKMRWTQAVTLTPASGAVAVRTLRLNSLFDPDFSVGGSSPQFFNTLLGNTGATQPYYRYRVLGAKVSVRFVNNGSSFAAFEDLVMVPSVEPTAPSTIEEAKEMGNSRYAILSGTNANPIKTLSSKYSIKRILGVKDLKDDHQTSGSYASNPLRMVFLHIMAQPLDRTSSTTVHANITVDFIVQLFERNIPQDD